MKIVVKGWVPRTTTKEDIRRELIDPFKDRGFFGTIKGDESYWMPKEWPPRKVTITVEVEG